MVISNYQISPEFDPNITVYYMEVPTSTKSIDVNAEAEDSNSTIKITGNSNLTSKENTVKITVTNGKQSKIYQINVNRKDSNGVSLQSLEIEGAEVQPEFKSNIYY